MTPERFLRRLRAELRLSGVAAWRALVELVNSNDVTHAASIAYYALLSLFPFLLLVISLLGSVTANEADRLAVLTFIFRYFPTHLDFVATQLDAFRRGSMRQLMDMNPRGAAESELEAQAVPLWNRLKVIDQKSPEAKRIIDQLDTLRKKYLKTNSRL